MRSSNGTLEIIVCAQEAELPAACAVEGIDRSRIRKQQVCTACSNIEYIFWIPAYYTVLWESSRASVLKLTVPHTGSSLHSPDSFPIRREFAVVAHSISREQRNRTNFGWNILQRSRTQQNRRLHANRNRNIRRNWSSTLIVAVSIAVVVVTLSIYSF